MQSTSAGRVLLVLQPACWVSEHAVSWIPNCEESQTSAPEDPKGQGVIWFNASPFTPLNKSAAFVYCASAGGCARSVCVTCFQGNHKLTALLFQRINQITPPKLLSPGPTRRPWVSSCHLPIETLSAHLLSSNSSGKGAVEEHFSKTTAPATNQRCSAKWSPLC